MFSMTSLKIPLILFILSGLLLTGCTDLPFLPKNNQEEGESGPFTALEGGKGVTVEFLPGKPPMNAIDGPFSLGIQFKNYNVEPVTFTNFIVGSTWQHDSFTNIQRESITLESAHTKTTNGRTTYLGPGTDFAYSGSGTKLRDKSLHYGPFTYQNIDVGQGTAFFVDMEMDYESMSTFQFCVFDVQSRLEGRPKNCAPIQTLHGVNQLGFGAESDPVAITSITKTLTPETENSVKITLTFTITDQSPDTANEVGYIVPTDDATQRQLLTFSLDSVSFDSVVLSCRSQTQTSPGRGGEFLELYLPQQGKPATVTCTGSVPLLEERKDYQYQTRLDYTYYQRVSTPYIPIRSDKEDLT